MQARPAHAEIVRNLQEAAVQVMSVTVHAVALVSTDMAHTFICIALVNWSGERY